MRVLLALLMLAIGLVVVAPADEAEASHFRANQLNWHTTATPDQVEFHLSTSVRCTYFFLSPCSASVGDTFFEYGLSFGDGASTNVEWSVTAVDVANDVVSAEAHILHQYDTAVAGTDVFTATLEGCCRLGAFNGHVNNPDEFLVASSIVDLGSGATGNPVSQISPIVDCPIDAVCQFVVPSTDPDGSALRTRLADASDPEGLGGSFAQPSGATVDPTSGLYSWDTTGATLSTSSDNTYYSTIVIVESLTAGGDVIARTPVDFFIRLSTSANNAPVFEAPTPADGTVFDVTINTPFSFDVQAVDVDPGDTVTLGSIGVPATASYATVAGNPATGTFSWTPSSLGTTLVTLTAADQNGRQAVQRTVTINVVPGQNDPPTADAGGPYAGDEGSPIPIAGTASDPDGDTPSVQWSATPDAAVDAGASCTFGDATALSTTVTCDDDGTWTLTLAATDAEGASTDASATLTVSNVDPVVAITAPGDGSSAFAGTPVLLSADVSDAGANDVLTCEVDYGDGTVVVGVVAAGACTSDHTYGTFGMFDITVTVTDDDGGSGQDTVTVTIVSPGTITGGGWTTLPSGEKIRIGFVVGYDDATASPRGQLQASWFGSDGTGHRFHGDAVTSLAMDRTSGSWTGTGRLDGVDGYSYEARAEDNQRSKGKNASATPDMMSLLIRDGSGAVVFELELGEWERGQITRHN